MKKTTLLNLANVFIYSIIMALLGAYFSLDVAASILYKKLFYCFIFALPIALLMVYIQNKALKAQKKE